MHILVISDNYFPLLKDKVLGGAERVLDSVNKVFIKCGHQVTVISPNGSDLEGVTHLPIGEFSKQHYLNQGMKPPRNLNDFSIEAIKLALKTQPVDVIFNHHKQPRVINWLANEKKDGLLRDIPIISWIHNPPIFGLMTMNTNEAYANLKDAGGLNLAVSGWCERMNNAAQSRDCCDDYLISQIAHEKFTVVEPEFSNLTLGRFVDIKNIHLGMDVALATDGRVIGYTENKEDKYYKSTIEARELLLKEQGKLYQGISYAETMDLMSKAGVFIQTSHIETSSCTQFEAAQRGVPQVILTKGNGHGSFEGSFMTGLNEWYEVVNTYRKFSDSIPPMIIDAIKKLENRTSDLGSRQLLADAIYNSYNEERFYERFLEVTHAHIEKMSGNFFRGLD